MLFEPLALPGVLLIRAEPNRDERGSFTRLFCADEFAAHGLPAEGMSGCAGVTFCNVDGATP